MTGNSRTRLANNSFLKVMCYWREIDCQNFFHHLVPLRRCFTLLYDSCILMSHLWHIYAREILLIKCNPLNLISWCPIIYSLPPPHSCFLLLLHIPISPLSSLSSGYFLSHCRISLSLDLFTDVSTPRIGVQDSFTNSFQHTPEKGKKEFEDSIQLFLNKCHPAMETLISKVGHVPSFMPSWTPSSSIYCNLSDHICQLNIP